MSSAITRLPTILPTSWFAVLGAKTKKAGLYNLKNHPAFLAVFERHASLLDSLCLALATDLAVVYKADKASLVDPEKIALASKILRARAKRDAVLAAIEEDDEEDDQEVLDEETPEEDGGKDEEVEEVEQNFKADALLQRLRTLHPTGGKKRTVVRRK